MLAASDFVWLAAPLMTLVMCLGARPVGEALSLLDRPDGVRKLHRVSTPLVGGLAIVLPWTLAACIAFAVAAAPTVQVGIVAAVLGFAAIGAADDRFQASAGARLVVGAGLAVLVAALAPALRLEHLVLPVIDLPLHLGVGLGIAVTALVLAGFVNSVNMADGINGLVPGLWAIWTAGALVFAPAGAVLLPGILLACILVVVAFNWRGRLFLGDAGSYAAGAASGLLAIWLYNSSAVSGFHAGVAVAWFLVPVLDCLRMIGVRLQRGQSPFSACRGHLHHRLEAAFGPARGVMVYYAVVGLPVGLTATGALSGSAAVVVAIGLYALTLLLTSRRGLTLAHGLSSHGNGHYTHAVWAAIRASSHRSR